MKTQIIILESHDDLISIRDRMLWAKSPRILLVLPSREKVHLGPLDLRILQQHAHGLGAQLGLVTRRRAIHHDARDCGLPTFRSTSEAQRMTWETSIAIRPLRRVGLDERLSVLRAMKDQLRRSHTDWTSKPSVRIVLFSLAVIAVFSIVSLFVPRASVILVPTAMEQRATIPATISTSEPSDPFMGIVLGKTIKTPISGKQSIRISSSASIPKDKSRGVVRFQNLTQSPMVIPAGTVVYSASVTAIRFTTLHETELDGKLGAFVEVPVESLEAGKIGNLPANAIQGIEGRLGAFAAVTNPEPTTGGSDSTEIVPSDSDRARLHTQLMEHLATQAAAQFEDSLGDEGIVMPNSLAATAIEREVYDPPAGQPGNLLSLAVTATFEVRYATAEDLNHMAEATMNASLPTGFAPKEGAPNFGAVSVTEKNASGVQHMEYEVRRIIVRQVDEFQVIHLVRGLSPLGAATVLQDQLPLAEPPEIHLSPSWWPWLPLVPFRITVTIP